MDYLKKEIREYVYELEKLLEKYTDEYGHCEDGRLICCKNNGKPYFYKSFNERGRNVRHALSNKPEIIKSLARKELLGQLIEICKDNVELLNELSSRIRSTDIETVINRMPPAYKKLPSEYFFNAKCSDNYYLYASDDKERIRQHIIWAKEPYEMSAYNPEGRKYPTSAGIMVRSKSEQHIVEQLVNYGVPFRYEQVLKIGDRDYAPDFSFRDRHLDPFYWEHAGMMEIDSYQSNHKRKMNIYESAGIVPWKNLIVTYDVDDTINVPLIKSIIENEVIPRL